MLHNYDINTNTSTTDPDTAAPTAAGATSSTAAAYLLVSAHTDATNDNTNAHRNIRI